MAYTVQGHAIGPIGYGMMRLTMHAGHATSTKIPEEVALATLKQALESGCNYWNGGDFYGSPDENSLTLARKYFEKYPEDADKVILNIKSGLRPGMVMDCSADYIREAIDRDIKLLGPKGFIHQFETGRKDPKVPYEETLGAIDEAVKAGKLGGLTVSEVNEKTIRKAAEKFKIEGLEIMLSIFETEPLKNGTLKACKELGIQVLAYCPLGQGFLTGKVKSLSDIPEGDYRRILPRFAPENFHLNLKLVEEVENLAAKKGCTPAQIAINWLVTLSKRDDMPDIIPIFGASSPERVKESATIVEMDEGDMKAIDEIIEKCVVAGTKYHAHGMEMLDHDTA